MGINEESIINLPASKSIVNRVLIIEKLSGKSFLNRKNISCDDTKVLSQVLSLKSQTIDIKNSGTAMRFMAAFLTQKVGNWLLIGSKSMQNRPVGTLVDALKTLGAEIEYCGKIGFLPIKICTKTPLNSNIPLTIENSNSSQTISALMLIAPNFANGLIINIKNCASFPYILLTKKIMEDYGAEVQITDNQIVIKNKKYTDNYCKFDNQHLDNQYNIEADWDSAAVWYAFLATNEKLRKFTLTNLFSDSYQPDSIVKNIFEKFGIKSFFEKNNLILEKDENFVLPKKFDFDFENYPDLVPVIAVTCCVLDVKFNFSGVRYLRIKESNRLDALQNGLKKCGFLLTQTENSLQWLGEKCAAETSPQINPHNDHRIAMSFAVINQTIDLKITNPNVVSKSYKNFWQHHQKIVK